MVSINVLAAVTAIAVCVPSGIVTFAIWLLERRLEKRQKTEEAKQAALQKEADDREEARKQNELMTLKCISASLALGEATARAVERIPDAHCDGDMHAALEYAQKVQHEQEDFIKRAGIDAVYGANAS